MKDLTNQHILLELPKSYFLFTVSGMRMLQLDIVRLYAGLADNTVTLISNTLIPTLLAVMWLRSST